MNQDSQEEESDYRAPPKPNPLRFWIVIAILVGLLLSQLSLLF